MKTGPVRDAQQTKQCTISHVSLVDLTSTKQPEVCMKEHKYNWPKVCTKNQNYPNMHMKKATKYVGQKQRSCT
jgi:hypothetical protein